MLEVAEGCTRGHFSRLVDKAIVDELSQELRQASSIEMSPLYVPPQGFKIVPGGVLGQTSRVEYLTNSILGINEHSITAVRLS